MLKRSLLFLLLAVTCPLWVIAQDVVHVYSKEIPWKNEPIVIDNNKIYSIQNALNEAAKRNSTIEEIIIHEGIYRETVKITSKHNNITIRNFENDYVLVTGADIVTGWRDAEGMPLRVMEADISAMGIQTGYTQLFANGKAQMMARYPDNTTGKMMEPMNVESGYALLSNMRKGAGENAKGKATFEGTPLPAVNLAGGLFRGLIGKNRQYVFGKISETSGNAVTFSATNKGQWTSEEVIPVNKHKFGWGFVIHKNLLDAPGEWFADKNKVYYMPEVGKSVENLRIEVQVRKKVLSIRDISKLTIKGINFVAGNTEMIKTSGLTMSECSMRYLHPFWTPNGYGQGDTDKTGIYLENSSSNVFKNNYIGHSWGNLFTLKGGQNNSFDNCVMEDFGWIGIFTSAIHISRSNNTNITHCTFGDAGRFHVRVDGGDAKVNILDSDFFGAMKMGEDAGPLEMTSTGKIGGINLKGSEIAYNKVHDVHGIPVSNGSYNRQKVTAFYMEDIDGYTAHHNLIYNIKANNYNGPHEIERHGEFLYMGPRYNAMYNPIKYYNNTVWGVDQTMGMWTFQIANWQQLGLDARQKSGLIKDGHFVNNIFMKGSKFVINPVRANLSSTGKVVNYVNSNKKLKLKTYDLDKYAQHCASLDHHLNPKTNLFIALEDGVANFADMAGGDFTLLTGSDAQKALGTKLPYITASGEEKPNVGALEGSRRVLDAGAKLDELIFRELENDPIVVPPVVLKIPGKIEAEDFTLESGITTENTTDTDGGQNIGFINNGDMVEYKVEVASAGAYNLHFRVASATTGGDITISSNGTVVGSLNVANTGGWQTWVTLSTKVTLPAGEQTLRLDFSGVDTYLLNINYIEASLAPVPVTTTLSPVHDAYIKGATGFNQKLLRVESGNRVSYLMFDLSKINGEITDVKLKMTCSGDRGYGDMDVALGDHSNWTETNLSGANKPQATTTLGTLNTTYTVGTTYTWGLQAAEIKGGKNISLIVSQIGGNDAAFASSENTAIAPQLEITYLPSSAPANTQIATMVTPKTSGIINEKSQLYPNPSIDGICNLDLKGHGDKVNIRVFDAFGTLVYEEVSQGKQVKLQSRSLQKTGTYFVQLQSSSKVEILRFCIH